MLQTNKEMSEFLKIFFFIAAALIVTAVVLTMQFGIIWGPLIATSCNSPRFNTCVDTDTTSDTKFGTYNQLTSSGLAIFWVPTVLTIIVFLVAFVLGMIPR